MTEPIPEDQRWCPRGKHHVAQGKFIKGKWCIDCQKTYYEANKEMIHARQARLMKALSDDAASDGRCSWRDGRCPNPPEEDSNLCKTHQRMDAIRKSHDYLGPIRQQGYRI